MKSLYIEKNSGYLYKSPLKVKFFSLALILLGIIFSANLPLLIINVFLVLLFCLLAGGGYHLLKRLKTFVYFALFIIIFHSVLNPANVTMFSIFGLEGFNYGLVIALRLIGIIAVAQTILITTPPKKIFLFFSSINKDLGLIMTLLIGFIPILEEELSTTSQAQQTRGLAWKNINDKIKAYLAMIIPVIIKALYRAQGMAALLMIRGYEEQDQENFRKMLLPLNTKDYRSLALISAIFFIINLALFVNLKVKVWF